MDWQSASGSEQARVVRIDDFGRQPFRSGAVDDVGLPCPCRTAPAASSESSSKYHSADRSNWSARYGSSVGLPPVPVNSSGVNDVMVGAMRLYSGRAMHARGPEAQQQRVGEIEHDVRARQHVGVVVVDGQRRDQAERIVDRARRAGRHADRPAIGRSAWSARCAHRGCRGIPRLRSSPWRSRPWSFR